MYIPNYYISISCRISEKMKSVVYLSQWQYVYIINEMFYLYLK